MKLFRCPFVIFTLLLCSAAYGSTSFVSAQTAADLETILPGDTSTSQPSTADGADVIGAVSGATLVERPAEEGLPIVDAELRRGVESLDKDVLQPKKTFSGMHMSDFDGFVDFGNEMIENNSDGALSNNDQWSEWSAGVTMLDVPIAGQKIDLRRMAVMGELRYAPPSVVPAASAIPLPPGGVSGLITGGIISVWWVGRRLCRGRR